MRADATRRDALDGRAEDLRVELMDLTERVRSSRALADEHEAAGQAAAGATDASEAAAADVDSKRRELVAGHDTTAAQRTAAASVPDTARQC